MSKVEYSKDILEAGYWLTKSGNRVMLSKDLARYRYWGSRSTDGKIPTALLYTKDIVWGEVPKVEYQLPIIFFI